MRERLHKYLARIGVMSRRKAEELIRLGQVSINGSTVTPPGITIDPNRDVVAIGGKVVNPVEELVYYAVHKPEGYLSTVRDPHGKKTVVQLVPSDVRVYPVGRLDRDSSGLMILTNDGELTHTLTHPSFAHEKEYEVIARWNEPKGREERHRAIQRMEMGIELFDGHTAPAQVKIRSLDSQKALFRITLKEGRKRQIRRMCQAIGLTVIKLKRIRMGKLKLGNLLPGEWKKIAKEDIL